jgi:glycosyltransferase involved in cell wall biosynthesis
MTEVAVSAVIPVHNGADYVAEAIRSTLSQTRPPIECLIIDDGSTDATAEVVREFGNDVTHIRHEREGVSAARNRGARLARGGLIGFLDHDDVWLPTKLERQVQALEDQGSTLALCAVRVIDEHGRTLRTHGLSIDEDLLTGMLMFNSRETVSCSSAGLMRRQEFLRMGGFDPILSVSADWDLLLRTLLVGRVAYVDEALVRYRVHATNMSRDIATMERDMTYAFAKAYADPRLPAALQARKRQSYGRLYRMLAGSYLTAAEHSAATRALGRALRHDPRLARELLRVGQIRAAISLYKSR